MKKADRNQLDRFLTCATTAANISKIEGYAFMPTVKVSPVTGKVWMQMRNLPLLADIIGEKLEVRSIPILHPEDSLTHEVKLMINGVILWEFLTDEEFERYGLEDTEE